MTITVETTLPAGNSKRKNAVTHEKITCNAEGQYVLNDFQKNVTYFDGKEKIAEVICLNGEMSVKSFSKKPIKLINSTHVKSLKIDTKGDLLVESPVNADYLTISGNNIEFSENIRCEKGITIEGSGNFISHHPIQTGYLNLTAENITLDKNVVADEDVCISAKNNLQVKESIVCPKEKVELKANSICLDRKVIAKIVSIQAEQKIQINDEMIMEDLLLKSELLKQDGKITCFKNASIEAKRSCIFSEKSKIFVKNHLNISSKDCGLYGKLQVMGSTHLRAERLDTDNEIQWQGELDLSVKHWNCYQKANIFVAHSDVKKQSKLIIEERFIAEKGSKFYAFSTKNVENFPISLSAGNLKTKGEFNLYATHLSGNQLDLTTGKTKLAQVLVDSKYIDLGGDLTLSGIKFNCEDLSIYPDKIVCESPTIIEKCSHLYLESSKNCEFKNFDATLSVFETRGDISLIDSVIKSTENKVSRNHGKLTLNNAYLMTQGQFYNGEQASLFVKTTPDPNKKDKLPPGIYADRIYNRGDVQIEDASLASKSIYHVGKNFEAIHANLAITKNLFQDNDAKLHLKKESHLAGEKDKTQTDIVMTGKSKLILDDKSQMKLHDLFSLVDTELTMRHAGGVIDQKCSIQGAAELNQSSMSAKKLYVMGDFKAEKSLINANEVNIFKIINATQSQFDCEEKILVYPSAKVYLTDSAIKSNEMEHQGYLRIESALKKAAATVKSENKQDDASQKSLFNFKKLTTTFGSKIEGDDLNISVDYWHHAGELKLTGNLFGRGFNFTNDGSISTQNIDLGFNGILNSGSMSANHIKLKSVFTANIAGTMSAHSFENASIIYLNSGFVSAYQQQNNSILSANFGISIPGLPEKNQFFSLSTGIGFLKVGLSSLLPQYSSGINFLSALSSVGMSGYNLWQHRKEYTWSQLTQTPLYEYAEKASRLNQLAVASVHVGLQGYRYGQHLSRDFREVELNANKEPIEKTDWNKITYKERVKLDFRNRINNTIKSYKKKEYKFDLKMVANAGHTVLSLVGPSYSNQSFCDLNYGGIYSNNINEMNFYGYNGANKFGFDSIVSNSFYLTNEGSMSAALGACHLNGYRFTNNGEVKGLKGVYANYKTVNLNNDSQHEYRKWQLKSDELKTSGEHVFNQSQLDTSILNQHHNLVMDNHSFLNVQGLHTLKENAALTLNNHSHARIHAQAFEKNNAIILRDHSTHQVETHWETQNDTRCIAEGTSEQAKKTQEDLKKADSLQMQLQAEKAELHKNKIKHEFENDSKEQEIESLQAKFDKMTHRTQAEKRSQIKQRIDTLKSELEHNKIAQPLQNQIQNEKINKLKTELESTHQVLNKPNCQFYAPSAAIKGSLTLKDGSQFLSPGNVVVHDKGHLEMLNNARLNAKSLQSNGQSKFYQAFVNIEKDLTFNKEANTELKDSHFKADSFVDLGKLTHRGISSINVENYQHSGDIKINRIADTTNVIYVKANTGVLAGKGEFDQGIFDIKQLADPSRFAYGQGPYQNYVFNQSLEFITPDELRLTGESTRNCDLSLTASSVFFNSQFKSNYNLQLISTSGDIVFNQDVFAKNIIANSAANIYNQHRTVNAELQLGLSAKGNIENRWGILRGGDHLRLIAEGDILNLCHETEYRGQHDKQKKYEPGMIIGGVGTLSDGVGTYLKSKGKFLNDASVLSSFGDNIVIAERGVEFKTRTHTYLSKNVKSKSILSFKKQEIRETDTQICRSMMHSENGKNIVKSRDGNIHADATNFSSEKGSYISARQNVQLSSLKVCKDRFEKNSSCWNIFETKKREHHHEAIPTIVIDRGVTQIEAQKGNFEGRGAVFLGEGDLYIDAGKNIQLSRDILDHATREKTRALVPSFFGINAINALQHSKNPWHAMAAEDPTLAKLNSLGHSTQLPSVIANTWNLGLNTFNTMNQVMTGVNTNNLTGVLLQRYGLGGAQGFNPTFNLGYHWGDTQQKYQTLGTAGIDRKGLLNLDAGERILFENGYSAYAQNAILNAKEINFAAAKLQSNINHDSTTLKLGISMTGDVLNVGLAQSHAESQSRHYANSQLKVDGHLDVNANQFSLNGGNIQTKTVSGTVDQMNIQSFQNEKSSASWSVEVNTSGMCAASISKHHSLKTENPSGMHVENGINQPNQQSFNVVQLNSQGGKITSNGAINQFAKHTHATDLSDTEKGFSLGLSMNVNDLNDSRPQQGMSNVSVNVANIDVNAKQQSTIFGEKGTVVGDVQGSLNTSNRHGYQVISDQHLQMQVDVPITTPEKLNAAKNNIDRGIQKIVEKETKQELPTPQTEKVKPKQNPKRAQFFSEEPKASKINSHKTSKQSEEVVVQDEKAPDKSQKKFFKNDIKMKTHDIRIGSKNGGQGKKQIFEIQKGKFIEKEDVKTQVDKKIENASGLSHAIKIAFKKDFFKGKETIYLQSPDKTSVIRPTLFDDGGRGFFAVELDTVKREIKVKLEGGYDLRFNLLQDSINLGCGETQYLIDAGSLCGLMRLSVSNERSMNLEARVEAGMLGPNASANFKSAEICLFGLTLQCDAALRAGVGVKEAVGCGATFDKTQPKLRLYTLVGGYFGFGAETEIKLNVGLDLQLGQRIHEEMSRISQEPLFKDTLDSVRYCKTEAEKEQPTTFLGKMWKNYKISCYEECENDLNEDIGRMATASGLFHISAPMK